MSNITLEEKNRISESNLHLFVERHIHDYWPCATNSARMIDFLQSQYGMTLEQYPYPLHLEEIETCFFYLQSEHKLLPRPEEVEEVDEAAWRRSGTAERVRSDHAARVAGGQDGKRESHAAVGTWKNRVGSKQGFPWPTRIGPVAD